MPETHLPTACTLTPDDGAMRIRRWRRLLDSGTNIERLPRLLTVRFDGDVAEELADLAAAEQGCCGFVTWTTDGTTLRVTGEPEGVDTIAATLN